MARDGVGSRANAAGAGVGICHMEGGNRMTLAYEHLLEVFENLNSGAWIDRKELAKVIGRTGWTLQTYDKKALTQLIADGRIEARREMRTRYGTKVWEYRKVENGN